MGLFSKKKTQPASQGQPPAPPYHPQQGQPLPPPKQHLPPQGQQLPPQAKAPGPVQPQGNSTHQTFPQYESAFQKQQTPTFPEVNHNPYEHPQQPKPIEQHPLPDKPEQQVPHPPAHTPDQMDIPIRQPNFMQQKKYPEREAYQEHKELPLAQQPATQPKPFTPPQLPPQQPTQQPIEHPAQTTPQPRKPLTITPTGQPPTEQSSSEDKPIFVKIGQYRQAMSTIQMLKQKLHDTEALITQLENLRTQEQQEINTAKTNLKSVKDKLMQIDKQLFEV